MRFTSRRIMPPRQHVSASIKTLEKSCGDSDQITVVTKSWGYENSWTTATSSGSVMCTSGGASYGDNQQYSISCGLPSGSYTLLCECSYGDGWHGGYIDICGSRYCADFNSGSSMTEAFSIAAPATSPGVQVDIGRSSQNTKCVTADEPVLCA